MNVISYRGPGMAGGLSSGLSQAWNAYAKSDDVWWHVSKSSLNSSTGSFLQGGKFFALDKKMIEGHYRYCNEFLWPIMHDLARYVSYKPKDHKLYRTFNQSLSQAIAPEGPAGYFIQDYQLAVLPQMLRHACGSPSVVFWHIPWPKQVDACHVEAIAEIARGLLHADVVGFHTQEYANNFARFVENHVTNSEVTGVDNSCRHCCKGSSLTGAVRESVFPIMERAVLAVGPARTQVVVNPLGIDPDYWFMNSAEQQRAVWHPFVSRTKFVLSVDRADYTKGVTERIRSIAAFFRRYPEWRDKVTFVQICPKTRTGLLAFDQYWDDNRQLAYAINKDWSVEDREPLIWIDQAQSAADLALLYRYASVMLVNPVRDGLNLTAKEFIACQDRKPGVLALSTGAGAWQELGDCAVLVDPQQPEQMAQSIHKSLSMNDGEKLLRMEVLESKIRENTLDDWWHYFDGLLEQVVAVSPGIRSPYVVPVPSRATSYKAAYR